MAARYFLGFFIGWGKLDDHHHFAKPGEKWASPWTPSQPRPVKWQIVRADRGHGPKPLSWIAWFYPDEGGAIYFDFGWSPRHRRVN